MALSVSALSFSEVPKVTNARCFQGYFFSFKGIKGLPLVFMW